MTQLTQHFTTQEMQCPHCGLCFMRQNFMDHLEQLRIARGRAILVTSGYRCPPHNTSIGGAKGSQHLKGNAADLCTQDLALEDRDAFLALCKQHFVNAIAGPGFIHVDDGPRRSWSY